MEKEWIDLGFGTFKQVVARIEKPGTYTVIRDDDAANTGSPWWAIELPASEAESDYENSGGTVSATYDGVVIGGQD